MLDAFETEVFGIICKAFGEDCARLDPVTYDPQLIAENCLKRYEAEGKISMPGGGADKETFRQGCEEYKNWRPPNGLAEEDVLSAVPQDKPENGMSRSLVVQETTSFLETFRAAVNKVWQNGYAMRIVPNVHAVKWIPTSGTKTTEDSGSFSQAFVFGGCIICSPAIPGVIATPVPALPELAPVFARPALVF